MEIRNKAQCPIYLSSRCVIAPDDVIDFDLSLNHPYILSGDLEILSESKKPFASLVKDVDVVVNENVDDVDDEEKVVKAKRGRKPKKQ